MSSKGRENCILHVGFPKCASTFLQYKVFPYLAIDFDNADKCQPFHFLEESIEKASYSLRKLSLQNTLVSYEGIVGSSKNGFLDYKERIDLISEIFPDADIIVVTRSSSYWKSHWAQHIKEGGTTSWANFKKMKKVSSDKIVDYLEKKFGRVLKLDFSELINDPNLFIYKICNFIEVEMPPNIDVRPFGTSISGDKLNLVRYLNMVSNTLSFLKRELSFNVKFKDRNLLDKLRTILWISWDNYIYKKLFRVIVGENLEKEFLRPFVSYNGNIQYKDKI